MQGVRSVMVTRAADALSGEERVDALAKEIDKMIQTFYEGDDARLGPGREDNLLIGYAPRGEKYTSNPSELFDPWWARWKGHHGTGQTAEMALLDLKASIVASFSADIEREELRVAERAARVQAMKALLPSEKRGGA